MKKQIVVIHGGDLYDTYEEYIDSLKNKELNFERLKRDGWKETLAEKLGEGFEVIMPKMPNSTNARYLEWKIWFEKLIPFLEEEVVLMGHSLGGMFLTKYLSENEFPKKIRATFLVSSPYDDKESGESLVDFVLPASLGNLQEQGGKIFIYHSEDDPVVPFADFKKYARDLPNAIAQTFKNKEHFGQEEFPELVKDVENLY